MSTRLELMKSNILRQGYHLKIHDLYHAAAKTSSCVRLMSLHMGWRGRPESPSWTDAIDLQRAISSPRLLLAKPQSTKRSVELIALVRHGHLTRAARPVTED